MVQNLHQKYFIVLFVILFSSVSFSQDNPWQAIEKPLMRPNSSDIINYDFALKDFNLYQLNRSAILNKLLQAPKRTSAQSTDVIIKLPNQHGTYDKFEMYSVQTLSDNLVQNYPGIFSFVGKSIEAKNPNTIRITITPFGFYAMVNRPDTGQIFINPYDKSGNYYMVFEKSSAQDLSEQNCMFDEVDFFHDPAVEINFEHEMFNVDDSNLRQYRLAVSSTGEYAQFHIEQAGLGNGTPNQQITAVLAAMTVTIDRVNSIYERDLGTTLQLIANNDQLIFLNPDTDPFTNISGLNLLSENQATISSVIGSANYDIGHVFSTGGGGIATFASLCIPSIKARGVTGLPNPVGDPFDVDYVCHEIGHQFGANHTQSNNCQRNGATAFEPGSGSTIMGYAGICPPNVQNRSDAYFHQGSINEIYQNLFSGSGGSCATLIGQSNSAPVIESIPNYIIPNSTAFFLDASATDAENDALTYNWEQLDNEESDQPPLSTSTNGPNFRSFPSSTASRRYFPNFNAVLNGSLFSSWEVVPAVARSMNFAVTVRDNNINVGQSAREFVAINFANVGPFQVTSQNTSDINWLPGETRTISWDVAGTTANGINTSNVNILLSTDAGETFDTVLASNTPNDGSEDIIVPSVQSPLCRILIEPVDNIYFAVNSTPFSIDTSSTCDTFVNSTAVPIPEGEGTTNNPQQGPLASSTINIPADINNITDITVTLDVSHTYINDLVFQLQSPGGELISLWSRNCSNEDGFNISFNDSGQILPAINGDCPNPITGTYVPVDNDNDLASIFSNATAGDWVLQFADFFPADTGTLNSWEIEICSATFAVQDNQLNEFTISPNPNNGIFELNFNQPLGNDTDFNVYDINGRLIESFKPINNSASMRVELKNQYQTGVYLLEIKNGNNSAVSKIIIKP